MVQAQGRQGISLRSLVWLGITILWLSIFAIFRPLMLPDEGRYVGVAWEMATSGNWLVPHLDGLPYFHKPPLFYWLTAISFKACGPYLLCSRIAPLLSALTMAFTLLWFLSRHLGKKTAVTAFVVLMTQPFFFASAQFANLDMLVACMISLTIMMAAEFAWQLERGRFSKRYLLLTYLFTVGGVLAKGLIGIVLPGAVIFLWLLTTRRLSYLRSFFWWPAVALFFLVVSPWFLLMESQFKGFLNYFFIHHHFERFAGTDFNNKEPFWFYVPALLLLTLPSSFWLLRFRVSTFRQWSPISRDVGLLMACWIGFIVLFFSIPISKPLGYIMPVLPAMAAITAMLIVPVWQNAVLKQHWVSVNVVVSVLACVISMLAIMQHAKKVATYQMAQQVKQLVAKNDQLIMMDKYRFDLPFYLRLEHPAWVVTNWQHAANVPLADSWERELLEARTFDLKTAENNLLSDQALAHNICKLSGHQAVWIVGDAGSSADHFAQLVNGHQPQVNVRGHTLWRFTSAEIATYCAAGANLVNSNN